MRTGDIVSLITASSDYFYGIDTKTGKLLWKFKFVNQRELNLTDAVCFNDYVLLTSGYGKGSELIRLKPASGRIKCGKSMAIQTDGQSSWWCYSS